MLFNFDIIKKKSLIFKALIFMGVHIGWNIKKINTKTNSFIYFIANDTYFFNLKRIIRDIKQSLFFIKKILLNGGFILIVTGFKFKDKAWIHDLKLNLERWNICLINKEWNGGLLTNIFGLKKTFNSFKYAPNLSIKNYYTSLVISKLKKKRKQQINHFFERFDILDKLYFIPDLLILLNDCGKTKGNKYLLKEVIKLEIPLIAFIKNATNLKYIDFPIFCNNESILFLKFYLILLKKIIRNFFK